MRVTIVFFSVVIVAGLAAGCGALEEEGLAPEEEAAAEKIEVRCHITRPGLTVHDLRRGIRGGALYIEGRIMNSGPREVYDVALHVIPLDGGGRPVKGGITVVHPVPRSLPPGVVGYFRVRLDPAGLAAVAIEARSGRD